MSDFWKKRRPRMTDEEERALWERVRTMPSEVAGASRRRSPWAALWARPSVRYGAPVLAVALVAVVWVAQRAPMAPRPESTIGTVGTAETEQSAKIQVAPPQDADQAPAPGSAAIPAPTPTVGQDARMRMPAAATVLQEESVEPATPRRETANRADDEGGAQPQSQSKEKATFATPPPASSTAPAPPPAPAEGKAEGKAAGTRVLAGSSAPSSPESVRGEAATGAADLQAYRAMPEAEAGAPTRVAAVSAAWGDPAGVRTLTPRILQDVLRRETEGPFVGTYRMPFTGEAVKFGGTPESAGVLTAKTPRERRAVLAMELNRAIALGDQELVVRVTDAATRLAAEHPGDAGARALVEWCIATTRAMKSK